MENNILFLSGIIVSCLVTTIVIFQFMGSRHKKALHNKQFYFLVQIGVSIFLMGINLLQRPLVNMLSWVISYGLVSYFLYFDDFDKPIRRVLEAEIMVLVFAVCEAAGVALLDFILWKMHMLPLEPGVETFLNMTFSKFVLLFMYYTFISPIWGRNEKVKFTKSQYVLHFIIAIFSFINMVVIGVSFGKIRGESMGLIMLVNMGFIIFADMYFLYFIRFMEDNYQLKVKLELLEQQATMQYKYYLQQEKKHQESLSILHDVDKHIAVMEGLYHGDNKEGTINYIKEINTILKPLIPQQLTNNGILNILFNDKIQNTEKLHIDLQFEIGNVDLSFMNPMDITTIFGNLLDNAIEACTQVTGTPWIRVKISPYYEMIAIKVENTSNNIDRWNEGRPVSQKGANHGIGLSNVERAVGKYDGSMNLSSENGIFQCNVLINM
ncbi:MAG TPA: ATP-binding protein [Lachnoclostridium sp.]|uniref:Sensor histidine kinase YesM n=1 Tax=[Clostridium] celerecrescens 18A TaxID=1286362 RepID=A0A2M8ZBQ6_9FIRM|nr:sensor histidine kinase [Lacrimispora celerecrescens]PJJ30891.1 sensor histidine kinase YesM [[Clostridium] celerecrescens 18A]HBE86300.1 ATP-binding protein [Lachnoclostridium sp.]